MFASGISGMKDLVILAGGQGLRSNACWNLLGRQDGPLWLSSVSVPSRSRCVVHPLQDPGCRTKERWS
jgi:hypothetical protein